jgi:hypothetical protein
VHPTIAGLAAAAVLMIGENSYRTATVQTLGLACIVAGFIATLVTAIMRRDLTTRSRLRLVAVGLLGTAISGAVGATAAGAFLILTW